MSSDPATYREMSKPFASVEEMQTAFAAFFEELGELRKKHKLPNVYCIIEATAANEEGEEGRFINRSAYGDPLLALPLAAYAFGFEKSKQEEMIAQVLADGMGRSKGKKKS